MISKLTKYCKLSSIFSLLALVTSGSAQSPSAHQFGPSYIPQRVYATGEKRFTDFEAMLAELARADVIFVGEQHDDPATHRLERAMLEGLLRRRTAITVAMEMFERDVQKTLDDYLAKRISEEDFLKAARAWPNYATDYRPLIEFARAHGWRVVASNLPRRFALQVSKQGLAAINAVPEAERQLIAAQWQCPLDDYFKRFKEVMANNHPGANNQPPHQSTDKKAEEEQRALIERFYYAQCLKDETMAESIVAEIGMANGTQAKPLLVHFNGAFHSDYHLGAAARTMRRLPKATVKVVSIIPVENLDVIKTDEYRKRADFTIFTLKLPPAKAKNAPAN